MNWNTRYASEMDDETSWFGDAKTELMNHDHNSLALLGTCLSDCSHAGELSDLYKDAGDQISRIKSGEGDSLLQKGLRTQLANTFVKIRDTHDRAVKDHLRTPCTDDDIRSAALHDNNGENSFRLMIQVGQL